MSLLRLFACVLVLVGSATIGFRLDAGETTAAPAPTSTTTAGERSLLANETRLYVAQLTEQRNGLRQENDTLRSRQGLLLAYGAMLTLLSGWLVYRSLSRRSAAGKKPDEVGTSPFPAAATAVVRKNATITIRNSSTQQAEVVEQIQTRRAYARSQTGSHSRAATRSPERRDSSSVMASVTNGTVASETVAPELDPAPPTRRHAAPQAPAPASGTVRIEQQSDRLDQVDVAVKPGSNTVRRALGTPAGR